MSKFGKFFFAILIFTVGVVFFIAMSSSKKSDKINLNKQTIVKKGSIEKNKLFSGTFEFSKKIDIKPKMNGIIQKIYKNVGDSVKVGEVIADIKNIVNPLNFESARKQLRLTEINYNNQKSNFERQETLFNKGIISRLDYEDSKKAFELTKEEYKSSRDNLFITKNGYSSKSDKTNKVIATSSGVLLDIPNKEGASVVKRNDFNEGTTIATIGDFNDITFNFHVTEKEIINLHDNKVIFIYVNALNKKKVTARIKKINYTSVIVNNISKYLIEAELENKETLFKLRPGFTGNSEIILDKKEDILVLDEKYLFFKNDSTFVKKIENLKTINQFVKTGISDDVQIEIIEGLILNDEIILPE